MSRTQLESQDGISEYCHCECLPLLFSAIAVLSMIKIEGDDCLGVASRVVDRKGESSVNTKWMASIDLSIGFLVQVVGFDIARNCVWVIQFCGFPLFLPFLLRTEEMEGQRLSRSVDCVELEGNVQQCSGRTVVRPRSNIGNGLNPDSIIGSADFNEGIQAFIQTLD
ncbi:hypothetical protein F0562_017715 [Nyssa sinensis]|uniref:Uncharacterized protein n=1 Tax=Nyssa sinensis TaxID=561372 RepID=A0A5J4ZIU9_9ASTE|nr:hypothetical protein F0562_017715 [Nyssa sinensis]